MVARKSGLDRAAHDEFGARSHVRAAAATTRGWLAGEIVAIHETARRSRLTRAFGPTPAPKELATLKPRSGAWNS
jgi:acetyl-CoA acetyltransferase